MKTAVKFNFFETTSKNKRKKLLTYRAITCDRNYHPLKNRKVKTSKIRTILDAPLKVRNQRAGVLSKRYSIKINENKFPFVDITDKHEIMFNWLEEIGVSIKSLEQGTYLLNGLECSLGYVLLFANRKRVERNLEPFFIDLLSDN